jgi:hypothetical protein
MSCWGLSYSQRTRNPKTVSRINHYVTVRADHVLQIVIPRLCTVLAVEETMVLYGRGWGNKNSRCLIAASQPIIRVVAWQLYNNK